MACSALRDISRSNQRHHSYCYLPVIVPDVANGRPSMAELKKQRGGSIRPRSAPEDRSPKRIGLNQPRSSTSRRGEPSRLTSRRAALAPRTNTARARHPGPRSRPTKIKRLQADGTDAILARRSMASPFWGGPPSAPRARVVSRQRPRRCAAPPTHDTAHARCSAQRSTAIMEQ